jgi:hypothetical protein
LGYVQRPERGGAQNMRRKLGRFIFGGRALRPSRLLDFTGASGITTAQVSTRDKKGRAIGLIFAFECGTEQAKVASQLVEPYLGLDRRRELLVGSAAGGILHIRHTACARPPARVSVGTSRPSAMRDSSKTT